MPEVPICRPVSLPPSLALAAADRAILHNGQNLPPLVGRPTPQQIAVYTGKRWKPGTTLTVGFLERVDASLAARILAAMNSWHDGGVNILFAHSQVNPVVRVTLAGDGYWSYLGTDILSVPPGEPTFCLQGWSDRMPDSEWLRVPPHEAGHSLGSPHEHARRAIQARLDRQATRAVYLRDQGWPPEMTDEQVFANLPESELMGTDPDEESIMAYQFSGECTLDHLPIVGGARINPRDFAFMGSVYPMSTRPDPPLPAKPPAPVTQVPVLAVRGPDVALHLTPQVPGVFDVDAPAGGLAFRLQVHVQRPGWAVTFAQPSAVVISPDGTRTPYELPGGVGPIKIGGQGRRRVEVHFPLDRQAAVRLLAP